METLSALFLRALAETDRPGAPSASAGTDPALEANLAAACARGHAAFKMLVLDDLTFARHLARTIKMGGTDPSAISTLAIEDLFLACACLAGIAGAAAAFSARHGATIRGTIARIVRGADNGEVEQQLVTGLLVGSVATPARIGSYAGKAPLDRWLGVAAQRAALMWLRDNRTEERARDGAAAEPAVSGHTHPEMAFLKDRYRGDFEQALKESLGRLPERQRTLLRLHLVNGVSIEKIGQMFAVSQPTASRWLAAARETLLDDIKATLGNRLGASSEELASLAGMVASRLDLSLSMLLRSR
ncbi:MAG TPA: sigma-70 family RNA polymerase sigma factor [Polyangia bacterium]|jgi:RNA polymerase sigma-70 factor (ECF subfamily)|nr:sigma-70 family RNA polymerase sigma factor [Polyangia bacterium]